MPKRLKKIKKDSVKKPIAKKKSVIHAVSKRAQSSFTSEPKQARSTISINVVDVDAKVKGKVSVPSNIFAAKENDELVAQAIRVYRANQRSGSASTKTRGEVVGSTRKIYRQKGTGRARHGAIRAPVFVGGGITFGPKPRDYGLDFPKKMKRRALWGALSSQLRRRNMIIVDGLEALHPRTKIFADAIGKFGRKGDILIVKETKTESILQGARNIKGVNVVNVTNLSPYVVLSHNTVIVTKNALPMISQLFGQ